MIVQIIMDFMKVILSETANDFSFRTWKIYEDVR